MALVENADCTESRDKVGWSQLSASLDPFGCKITIGNIGKWRYGSP